MRAIVIGASSGLGRCIATDLGQQGASVALLARREYASGSLMDVRELLTVVGTVLRCGASARIPSVTVVPRPAA